MPFWSFTYFMDANSPSMEQMIFFHDHSMMMMISIILFLMLLNYYIISNNFLNFYMKENQLAETMWTITPMFMLIIIAIPSLRLLYLLEEIFWPDITMKIIGHQWYWSYELSNFEIIFDSFMNASHSQFNNWLHLDTDNSINLPLNSSLRLLVTSMDVIHAWTIQSLGVKTDAVPGRLNQINMFSSRPGKYFGQCSEICGMNHSFMPISLNITSMETFNKWMKIMLKSLCSLNKSLSLLSCKMQTCYSEYLKYPL
uniref:Cytochrome c oxidase subunit 2 n=1 Tax=Blattisocius keegani TaxID=2337216 RepID=A0A4Y5QEJ3_9ACAR|nr:cytochrome c oxidase subunit II [Blattisocius keegani]